MRSGNLKRNEKANKASHVLAGLLILLHGWEKLDGGEHFASGIFFIAAGLIFLTVALFHHKLIKHIRSADAVFATIEAVLALIIAIEFIYEGKQYLQYAYFLAAAVYFARAIFLFRKAPAQHHSPH